MNFLAASRALVAVACASVSVQAQTYERVDVNALGQPANGNSRAGAISRDGRFVVYLSNSTNLAGVGVLGAEDVFLHDRALGSVTRITSLPSYPQSATSCGISGDGSKICFTRNLGTPTQNPSRGFIHDVASGVTTEVLASQNHVYVSGFTFDGRFVLVSSQAPSSLALMYRFEVATGALLLVNQDPAGNPFLLSGVSMDDTGTIVAFSTPSSAIVPNDTNGVDDVFVRDVSTGAVTRVSIASSGAEGNGGSYSPMITGDGRYVVMMSRATNLAHGDTNTTPDVYLRDLQLGITSLESLTSSQVVMTTPGIQHAGISADGSTIAIATGLVPFSPAPSIFVRDRLVGALIPTAPANTYPHYPAPAGLTGDGREMLLISNQPELGVVNHDNFGVFVVGLGPRCSTSGYCTSLPNSTGAAAAIGAQGDASRTLNNLVIAGIGLPNNAIAMVASGTGAIDPGVPFGNGLLCIGGGLVRHGIHVAAGGVVLDHQDVNSAEYAAVSPGSTRFFQIVYRDPAAGGAMFNSTDAVAVTFCW